MWGWVLSEENRDVKPWAEGNTSHGNREKEVRTSQEVRRRALVEVD